MVESLMVIFAKKTKSMSIEFHAINDPKYWLQMIAEQLSVPVVNDEVAVPAKIGQGVFRQYYPCEWLTVSYSKIRVHEPMSVHREGRRDTHLIPVVFYIDKFEQCVGDDKFYVGRTERNGIYMHSSDVDSKWLIPANGKWNITLALTFDRDLLIKELGEDSGDYIVGLLSSRRSFYVFETFNAPLLDLCEDLVRCMDMETSAFTDIQIYGKSLLLFYQYLKKLNVRMRSDSIRKLHSSDVDMLFKVRGRIIDNISSPPLLNDLAKDANMSVSKLQKSFKQVFGVNISQFALHEKMKMAKNFLSSELGSVSEIGYRLGYSNLTHFSKAFYNEFNINPSDYLRSVKGGN